MTSLVLLAWAAAVAVLARPALTGRWTTSLPRLTVGLWLGAELSVTVAVLTAGLLVAVPPAALAAGLEGIVAACTRALAGLGAPNETLAVIGLLATAALVARLLISLIVTFIRARRWRRRHLAALLPLARQDAGDEWTLVDHATAAVYCLPGRPGNVIVTSAAIDTLTADELAAVLGHERAHLRGRHHLLVALAVAFHRALPGLPMAAAAETEIRRLVEHLADDRASKRHGRQAVATAIVRLADRTPQHALGAAAGAVDRVRRMLAPPARPRILHRLVAVSAIGLLMTGPPAVAVASAGLLVQGASCSAGSPPSAAGPAAARPAGG
ncbi:M56 family metallopeptidase [Micromonospora aurantiaca]|uniref:M56 family metallopeptidase n=1 Tax=Micromonospora aurantiaca (nom. illeg.) TaxID=47850 RepID=A0ABQ6ULC8_9ACTN|nr:M56 family metallopeptidase [Micromonospora aurantiaca]KAB1117918.1 M56 family metallopeptidase [Micromonospora aurantiaca]UFN92636.1 M56 family metallopeptidase [Micromonospora aurantiaca]